MQQRQRPNWIRGCVENELSPLRAASILQRNRIHSCPCKKAGELFDARHRRIGGLERTNPCVAFDVVTDMAGSDRVTRGERRATNDVSHVLSDEFFVAHAVLHRTHGALLNRIDVILPEVVGPNLCLAGFCEMRREQASNRTAPNDADLHFTSTPNSWQACSIESKCSSNIPAAQPRTRLAAEPPRP